MAFEMANPHDAGLVKCLTAFAARDYVACYQAAMAGPLDREESSGRAVQLLVAICMQRLGQERELKELPRLLLGTAADPWEKSMVRLTFGQTDIDSVWEAATDDEKRCQASFYAGARLLTTGRPAEAERIFQRCAGLDAECLEKRLVEIELAAMSTAAAIDPAEQMFVVFNGRARSALSDGRIDEAIRIAGEACDLARRTWGQDCVQFTEGLTTLLAALTQAGRTAHALEIAPLAVKLAAEHHGEDDPEFANVLNVVGYLHKITDDLDEATRLYRHAADILGRSPDHRLESAVILNNIGQLEAGRRDFGQAETLFQDALAMLAGVEDTVGLHAGIVNNLALVYGEKGDLAGSERLHRQALEYRREQFGEDHPQYANSLNNLAQVYKDQRRFAEAEPLFLRAADILQRTAGGHHPHTQIVRSALLEIYQETGQSEAMERLLAKVRTEIDGTPEVRPHVLHPLPGLTPLFQRFKADIPQTANEPEFAGGAVDWRSPAYQELFGRLAEDYAENRYGECVRRAILLNANEATHEVVQIWLMCFVQASDPRGSATVIRSLIADPWHSALVGVTLGEVDPADLEEYVDEDEKFSQLLYYAAQRQMADGHTKEALGNLGTCAESGVECFETWMAARILRSPPRATDRDLAGRVRALNATVTELLSRRDVAAAAGPAEEAWRLAAGLADKSQERVLGHYNFAMVSYWSGDLPRAESLLRELVAATRDSGYYDRDAVAGSLNILGVIYTDLAQFDRAEPALLDALEELRRAGRNDDADYAQVQGNLAELYREMGDVHTAIRICRTALKSKQASLGRDHPEYARTLNNLGLLYLEIDDTQTAENLLAEAQRIRQEVLPPGHIDLAGSAHILANLYLRQERYAEAERSVRTGMEISRATNGTGTLSYAAQLNTLASLCMMTGELEPAVRHLQECHSILVRIVGALHPGSAGAMSNLALMRALSGDIPGALQSAKQSEEATSSLLFDVFATASERQRLQVLGDMYRRMSVLLSLVATMDSPADEAAAVYDLILHRKGVVGDAQLVLHDEMHEGSQPELRPKIEHLHVLREKIAGKTLSGPGLEGFDAHIAMLTDWTEEKERLEGELARAIPGMRLEQRMREVNGSLIRSLLPDSSALVEIVRFGLFQFTPPVQGEDPPETRYRYWAFVLRPEPHDSLRWVDLGDGADIDRLVANYRNTVLATGSSRDIAAREPAKERPDEIAVGMELRAAVFDKLRDALGETRRLFVCPDGDLARVPWEVLPFSPDRRLIDEYEISYLGVGRDLIRLSVPAMGKQAEPSVIANPDFDLAVTDAPAEAPDVQESRAGRDIRASNMRFAPLAGTSGEGQTVAALLGVQPIMGAAATKAAVKSCRHPVILHLATHGFFLPDPVLTQQPVLALTDTGTRPLGRLSNADDSPFLRSGLVLAGINTWLAGGVLPAEAQDGILTAEDVAGMDLSGTELVTLSACETGLGSQHLGEGVLGLRRAFISAGARTVVMSLWQVPDDETRTLMTDFYQRVLRREGRAVALRDAQLELRKQKPDPYYWGAFICQGDPDRLDLRAKAT